MRSRIIKPSFFNNEQLAKCDPLARILFQGLWCAADREGRVEDRPLRLKVDILPYEQCDIDPLLTQLVTHELIDRYEVDGVRVITVLTFIKHQRPHFKEAPSELPARPGPKNGKSRKSKAVSSPAEHQPKPGSALPKPGSEAMNEISLAKESPIMPLEPGLVVLDPDPCFLILDPDPDPDPSASDPDPDRARAAIPSPSLDPPARSELETHLEACLSLWAAQEAGRSEIDPTVSPRQPTEERLSRIALRLAAGATFAECEHVIAVYTAEGKLHGSLEWFDGVTNWRPDCFERALGRSRTPKARGDPRKNGTNGHGKNLSTEEILAFAEHLEAEEKTREGSGSGEDHCGPEGSLSASGDRH